VVNEPPDRGGRRADDVRGRRLLAVFAHPDDESLACGGLLAWCAHLGARVSLLCVTHGEHEGGKRLAKVRAAELREASRVLGVADVALLEYQDGMLPWSDAGRLEADIREAIERSRADVVITFGGDGLYWHPDHIAVHERTTAAVAALGGDGPALYYVTMPAGSMRRVAHHAEESLVRKGDGRRPLRILGIADADAFGADAEAPTLVVCAGEFAKQKLAAIRCHRSQLIDDALMFVTETDAEPLLGVEHYRRAPVGSRRPAFLDSFGTWGQTGVRPGSDQGQTGVRPGSDPCGSRRILR
jgi:LmbE family N-acetylglucosaminyl deacetylase